MGVTSKLGWKVRNCVSFVHHSVRFLEHFAGVLAKLLIACSRGSKGIQEKSGIEFELLHELQAYKSSQYPAQAMASHHNRHWAVQLYQIIDCLGHFRVKERGCFRKTSVN